MRWKAAEGNYRDDISAIVVFLPILPDALSFRGARAGIQAAHTFVQDAEELARERPRSSSEASTSEAEADGRDTGGISGIELQEGDQPEDRENGSPADDFTQRRLSVASGMTQEAPPDGSSC
mgnify:CR=1 FL=1